MRTFFVLKSQVQHEVAACIKMVYDTYTTFGFEKIDVKLSTRPEKRVGSDEIGIAVKKPLADALKAHDIDFEYQPGEGRSTVLKLNLLCSIA